MDNDLPDFAGEQTPAPAALAPEPVAAPAPAPLDTPAVSPEPAPPAPVAPTEPPVVQHVPLPTFLDLRDRFTAADKEAKELREWRQQQEAAARRQPLPDPEQDPVGYQQAQAAQFQGALYSQTLTFSRNFAELKHGPDVVKAAFDWGLGRCDEDPFFNQKVRASSDPVGVVVEEWKREQVASKVDPTKYEAFLAWEAANPGALPAPATPQAAPGQPPAARPVAPRPSLAAAPSAGASAAPEARDGEQQFGAMFGT